MKLKILIMLMIGLLNSKFSLIPQSPPELKNIFENFTIRKLFDGEILKDYSILTYINFPKKNNLDGCKKIKKLEIKNNAIPALLLKDTNKCSLSTQIHYTQASNAGLLIIEYEDDKIEEAEVDNTLFGVKIPIFLISKKTGTFMRKIKNSVNNKNIIILLKHEVSSKNKVNKIDLWYSPDIYSDLKYILNDLNIHLQKIVGFYKSIDDKNIKKDFKNIEFNLKIALGTCKSCKDSHYKEPKVNCYSGGKYCALVSRIQDNSSIDEALTQICIRDNYGSLVLLNYLDYFFNYFNKKVENDENIINLDFINSREYSYKKSGIDSGKIVNCINNSSIKKIEKSEYINLSIDENSLLQKEQQDFFNLKSSFGKLPRILINGLDYEGEFNFKNFSKYLCDNNLIDCSELFTLKYGKYIMIFFIILSLITLFIMIRYCKWMIRKKMKNQMDNQFQDAIQKYLN